MKKIALVDMDGTLCDFDGTMQRDYAKIQAPGEPQVNVYDENVPYIKARLDLIKGQKNWWFNLPKFKLGFDVYNLIKEIGYKIVICTRGPRLATDAWAEKKAWCNLHIPGDSVIITEDKGIVYGRVLVDDWPSYIKGWLKHRPRGLVIMPAHFWNEGSFVDDPRVVRYDGTNLEEVKTRLVKRFEEE